MLIKDYELLRLETRKTVSGMFYTKKDIEQTIELYKGQPIFGTIRDYKVLKTPGGERADVFKAIDPHEVAFNITNLRLENNLLLADIKILNTPNGILLQQLLNGPELNQTPYDYRFSLVYEGAKVFNAEFSTEERFTTFKVERILKAYLYQNKLEWYALNGEFPTNEELIEEFDKRLN